MSTIEIAKPLDGLDCFSALMSNIKSFNGEKQDAMADYLIKENKQVAKHQAQNAEAFCDSI